MRFPALRIVMALIALLIIAVLLNCSSDSDEKKDQPALLSKQADSSVGLPKMIDLGSKHCIPCKKMAPILDSLKVTYQGKAEIIFIDVKENKKAAQDLF